MSPRRSTVHAWLNGQRDNVGDSLLRRPYLTTLRSLGRVNVWAGTGANGYRSNLGFEPTDTVPARYRTWLADLYRGSFRGDTVALNAGEFTLSKAYAVQTVLVAPALLTTRIRGGQVVWWGAGVPPQRWIGRLLYTPLTWLATDVRWRDPDSARNLALAPTMPDWGFAAIPRPPSATPGRVLDDRDRSWLTVVLRGDRVAPSAAWLEDVKSAAERLGLRLHVAVQVGRDGDRAHWLAERWSCAATFFDTPEHRAQEDSLRRVYRRSAIVLSDRLHALILGATEGAVPLAWCETSVSKVERHLAPHGFDWTVTHDHVRALADLSREQLSGWLSRTVEICSRLRDELEDQTASAAGDSIRRHTATSR